MSRLCVALICTGMLLPSLLWPNHANGLYDNAPGVGEALAYQTPGIACFDVTAGLGGAK